MIAVSALAIFLAKYAIFLLVFGVIIWFLLKVPNAQKKDVLIFAACSLPLTFLASLVASQLYNNPRPFVVDNITPLIAHAVNNGFPSDHTLLSAALASIVWRFDRWAGAVSFGTAIAIGLSRVYVGVHHLVDILGALVIAIGVAWALSCIFHKLSRTKPA